MIVYLLIMAIAFLSAAFIYLYYLKPKLNPLNKATALVRENKLSEAITEYKRILYNNPDDFIIHNKIAELFLKLKSYDQAVFHFNEILRIDKYNLDVEKLNIVKQLANIYSINEDMDRMFQSYLEVLKLNPEDIEALYNLSFITLGQEEFEIALKYFDKLVKFEDSFEVFFGAGICNYQCRRTDEAVKYFREALSIKPASDIASLALSFALQRAANFREAGSYLSKLYEKAGDDVKFIIKRMMAFQLMFDQKPDHGKKAFEELLSLARSSGDNNEIKLSLYDLGFACIKVAMYDQAYNYWNELFSMDNGYKNIRLKLDLLKKDVDNLSRNSADGFDASITDYIDDWEASPFPENFLWNICGLKSEKEINIKGVVVTAKVPAAKEEAVTVEVKSDDSAERLNFFCNLDSKNFRVMSNRIILELGYKVDEILETYRDADGVDFIAMTPDTKRKVLVWIRRWKETNVGEITLRNFAQAINDIKAQEGLFITTAELTSAALGNLKKLNKIKVIYPSELNSILKRLIK